MEAFLQEWPRLRKIVPMLSKNGEAIIEWVRKHADDDHQLEANKLILIYYLSYAKKLSKSEKDEMIELVELIIPDDYNIILSYGYDYGIKSYAAPQHRIYSAYIERGEPFKAIRRAQKVCEIHVPWVLLRLSREQLLAAFAQFPVYREKFRLLSNLLDDAEKWRFRPDGSIARKAAADFKAKEEEEKEE